MSHTCKNLIVICMDFRFQSAITDWAEAEGYTKDFDLVSLAGAQKSILDEDTRTTALKQIDLSVDLHGSNQVVLIAHQDCGAYGGSVVFENWEQEREKYIADMEAAEVIIKQKHPAVKVRKMILTFDDDNISFEEV